MSETIRILIVTREAVIRRGLVAYLAADKSLEIVGSVDNASGGYRLADELLPDVALIGTTLSDAPGLAAAAELHRNLPSIATVVLSANESAEELLSAVRASASAYCGQDIDERELIDIIKRCASGEYVINEQMFRDPKIAIQLMDEFRKYTDNQLVPATAFSPLTDRELEILTKVSEGLTNAGIGTALGISAQTVKNHLTSILRKLQVNDRTQAVVKAIQNGWIVIDGATPTAARR
jgi:DNA-binding NarL/FixJ family response regulator